MLTNFFLIIIFIIVLIESYIIFALIKLIKKFLGEIQSIKGIQFGSIQIGEEAPLFRELDHRSNRIVLKKLISEKEVTLLFLSSSCLTCREIINNFNKIIPEESNYIIAVFKENPDFDITDLNVNQRISIINAPYLFTSYQITATPYIFMIDFNGKVKNHSEIKSYSHLENFISTTENAGILLK